MRSLGRILERIERGSRHSYLPALDGLRALAVAAVVLYHLGLPRFRGGYLGVDLFFVLSGFLITGLLRTEWDRRGAIDFRRFYARRARRLLPALLVVLGALVGYVAADGALLDPAGLRADVLATLGYVANWRFVAAGQSYFDQFADPSPLRHAWSLAIEEQYYLLWPLLLLALLRLTRGSRRVTLAATVGIAAASAVAMAVVFTPGGDPSRAYYGTDTRAFELLAGSALALFLAGRRPGSWRVPDGAGLAALTVLVGGWLTVADDAEWMYRGGFLAATLLGVVVVAAVAREPGALGPLGRALSVTPLRGLGRISYGVYLWHWPVIVLLRPPTVDVSGDALRVLQVVVTLVASIVSYVVVEQPVRTDAWAWLRGWSARLAGPAVASVLVVVLLVAGASPPPEPSLVAAPAGASRAVAPAPSPALDLTANRTPTAGDPLRVLLVGDSVMVDAAPGIEAALEATGAAAVEHGAFPGFGLTHTASWRRDWATTVAEVRPDVVVALLGAWDAAEAIERGREWYATVVDDATAVLSAGGARVVWLGWPPTRPPAIAGRPEPDYEVIDRERALLDATFAAVAARRPGDVAFVSTGPPLTLDGGEFSAFLPDATGEIVRARKRDNTHFCPAGAERLGRYVLAGLTPVYALPAPDPAWVSAGWRSDRRFDDPPGACR